MGLFFKSREEREEQKRLKEAEEKRRALEKDRARNMESVRAFQKEHKEEIGTKVRAEEEIAALIREDRILICGPSMVGIMMERDRLRDAKEVVTFLSAVPDEIGKKCGEVEPSLLLFLCDDPDPVKAAQRITALYPAAVILVLLKDPDSLRRSTEGLKAARIMAVAKRSCPAEEFAAALKKAKEAAG